MYGLRPGYELLFTLFERNGVYDAFPGRILQAFNYRIPVRGVDHHRGSGYGGLTCGVAQEHAHLFRRIDHRVVHIDVDDAGAAFDLGRGDGQGLVVTVFRHQTCELAGTRDIRPFPYIREIAAAVY